MGGRAKESENENERESVGGRGGKQGGREGEGTLSPLQRSKETYYNSERDLLEQRVSTYAAPEVKRDLL